MALFSFLLETLKELWQTTLLPSRKLHRFAARPLEEIANKLQAANNKNANGKGGKKVDHRAEAEAALTLWYFEHELKSRYEDFVQILKVQAWFSFSNLFRFSIFSTKLKIRPLLFPFFFPLSPFSSYLVYPDSN